MQNIKKKYEWNWFEIDFTEKDFDSSIRFENKLFCIIHYILHTDEFFCTQHIKMFVTKIFEKLLLFCNLS